jgi:hypothetical protein
MQIAVDDGGYHPYQKTDLKLAMSRCLYQRRVDRLSSARLKVSLHTRCTPSSD